MHNFTLLIYFISTLLVVQPIPIVIIDSLTAGMAGAKGQCNFGDEVDPVLRSLERLAVDFSTAVVVCHHMSVKAASYGPVYQGYDMQRRSSSMTLTQINGAQVCLFCIYFT